MYIDVVMFVLIILVRRTEIELLAYDVSENLYVMFSVLESAGGVVVTTSACTAGGTGSISGTGSCDIKIWLSTLGTVYPS